MCHPTLSARVRLLGSTKASKNDRNDALSTADRRAAPLRPAGRARRRPHRGASGCWSTATTTSSRCAPRPRAGSTSRCGNSSPVAHPGACRADRAAKLLRSVRPDGSVAVERKRLAGELLADVRRLDRDIAAARARVTRRRRRVGHHAARGPRGRPDRRRVHPRSRRRPRPVRRPRTGSRPTTAPPRSRRPADPASGTGSTLAGTAN